MPKLRLLELLTAACVVGVAGASTSALAAASGSITAPMQIQAQINQQAVQSQKKIDSLSDQTQSMLNDYLDVTEQTDRLRTYNNQLAKLIQSQEQEKQSLNRQMGQIDVVQQGLIPLMLKMIDSLEQFTKLDIPYQLDDRLAKIQDLRTMMDSADVTIAEKYRKVMQAYEDEIDAGNHLLAYRGQLSDAGKNRTVDFLQVGRLVLAYQTLDRNETGYWNKNTRKWEVLPDDYRQPISKGLQVAHKEIAPELLELPVPAPESAK